MRASFIALLLLLSAPLIGQQSRQSRDHEPAHEQAHEPHFRIAAFLSHTFISGVVPGTRLAIPSYGLDLEYWPSHKLGIGLHSDLELENFVVEREHQEVLEREYPVVASLDVLYRPWQGLVFQVGPGVEIDRNQHFFLFRLGMEYEVELGHHWDLYPTAFYDARADAFSSFSIGLGVGKRF